MRNVVVILTILTLYGPKLSAQLRSFFGELRYQHEFQDVHNTENGYSRFARLNPQFLLGVNGHVLAPEILDFQILSSIQANFRNFQGGGKSVDGRELLFTLYNFTLTAMPGYPISGSVQSFDQNVQTKTSEVSLQREGVTSYRQRRQTATVSVNQIPFLPAMRFMYRGTKNRTDQGQSPYERNEKEYEFTLSQSTKSSAFTFNAYRHDNAESLTKLENRFTRVLANATKTLSENHRVDLTSDYYVNGGYHSLASTLSYTAPIRGNLQLNASLLGRNQQSQRTFSLLGGATQSLVYTVDEHLLLVQNASGETARDLTTADDGGSEETRWNNVLGMLTMNHARRFGLFGFTNALSAGYTRTRTVGPLHTTMAASANSLDISVGRVGVAVSQSIAASVVTGYDAHELVTNTGSATLTLRLPFDIMLQGVGDVQDDRRMRTAWFPFHRRSMRFQGQLMASLHVLLPLSIYATGGTMEYSMEGGGKTRTFTWAGTVGTPSFFLQGLAVNYQVSRSFDFMTRAVILNQTVSANYQWRAVTLQLRLMDHQYIERKRELWFELIRPF